MPAGDRDRCLSGKQGVQVMAGALHSASADGDREALRERLAGAGLVFDLDALPEVEPPTDQELRHARAAAGRATPLARLVSKGRR